jgi:hypothetical protein
MQAAHVHSMQQVLMMQQKQDFLAHGLFVTCWSWCQLLHATCDCDQLQLCCGWSASLTFLSYNSGSVKRGETIMCCIYF